VYCFVRDANDWIQSLSNFFGFGSQCLGVTNMFLIKCLVGYGTQDRRILSMTIFEFANFNCYNWHKCL
jgi:hypothetical protein